MVACTDPKRIKAPVPVLRLMYAKEKATAYKNRKAAETSERMGAGAEAGLAAIAAVMSHSATAPEVSLSIVNPAASISARPSARRQRMLLEAKAVSASPVKTRRRTGAHSLLSAAGGLR